MFVMMMPMIQTHAAPTDVIENNESGIPDRTLYQNILKVLGKQSTDTFTEQEASSVEELGVSENRLTDVKEIKNLKNLERIYAFCNKIKTLPNLKQFSKLSYVFTDFSDNLLSEKELEAKLPKRFLAGGKSKKAWLADQKEFQKLNRTIKLVNPKKKTEISVKTKEISGYAFPEAYVELKKWGGAKVQVNLYKYSKEQKRNVQVVCNTILKVKKK